VPNLIITHYRMVSREVVFFVEIGMAIQNVGLKRPILLRAAKATRVSEL
jgi:hypothetical protein